MIVITNSVEIQEFVNQKKREKSTLGFVPTMGALHKGHLSLIDRAKRENDYVVCSIFVNPLQFNRLEDLKSYPIKTAEDIEMLSSANCDVLFLPNEQDLYSNRPNLKYDFGNIGKVMEGLHRPGHFEGVAAVINQFFKLLQPDNAYFGEKDFQQLAVIRWLANQQKFSTAIIGCETIRTASGLAMSSRNLLLSEKEKITAAKIYEVLSYARNNVRTKSPQELVKDCLSQLEESFKTEYFSIADERTLMPINSWNEIGHTRAFVAAYLGNVRLIDNLSLIK